MSAYYNEIDPFAAAWLRNLIARGLIAPGDVDERDIRDVQPADVQGYTQCHWFGGIGVWSYALRCAGWADDTPVWTGSCPCQPFSAAGKRGGTDDTRHLWPDWFRLIAECRPPVVFGEQVSSKDGLQWLDLVSADMEGAGYAFGALDTCAASVGAPHIRQRLYFVADTEGGGKAATQQPRRLHGIEQGGAGSPGLLADADNAEWWADAPRGNVSHGSHAGWSQDAGDIERRGSLSSVGHPQGERSERGAQGGRKTSRGAEHAGGLGDTEGDGNDGALQSRQREGLPSSLGTGAAGGFWRDADWLPCRDGKARPVEPGHVKMVDGPAAPMGRVCANATETKADTDQEMHSMRVEVRAEAVSNDARRPDRLQSPEVLRSVLHGRAPGGANEDGQPTEQPPSIRESGGALLRSMQADRFRDAPVCSPSRRESDEQRSCELEDVVRLLSPSLSLAQLYGDRRTEGALRVLRRAIYETGMVRNASIPVQAVWASLSEEAKGRIRMGFDASRWRLVEPFPLVVGARSRVGRLRGYGNALVAPLAAEFIAAYREARLMD